jgi:hypothetical protein
MELLLSKTFIFSSKDHYSVWSRIVWKGLREGVEGGRGERGSRGLRIIEPQEMMKIGREGNNPFEGWSFDLESGSSPLFTF